jgi:hypothetical protein
MKKGLKILGIVILSVLGLIFIIEIITLLSPVWLMPKWIRDGTNMGEICLGDMMFNSKLNTCAYAYANPGYTPYTRSPEEEWSIQGLKNGKCVVKYELLNNEPGISCNNPPTVSIKHVYLCKLPAEIYTQPKNINWNEILKSDYCS